ncbi:hypothetical protein C4D60_Mb10t05300 [Musa balbisiana]|uniref:BHLH domain-containing protein n=1 Tax=Musa balbisiana TaxID=52838 RepID=A0A4S8IUX6_MUSBA|nr:hypothetical protein C4D60_Mb10t05300 [Musa balbisiana]
MSYVGPRRTVMWMRPWSPGGPVAVGDAARHRRPLRGTPSCMPPSCHRTSSCPEGRRTSPSRSVVAECHQNCTHHASFRGTVPSHLSFSAINICTLAPSCAQAGIIMFENKHRPADPQDEAILRRRRRRRRRSEETQGIFVVQGKLGKQLPSSGIINASLPLFTMEREERTFLPPLDWPMEPWPTERTHTWQEGETASKLLKETCSYIRSLHREVDDLSDRLSDLMSTMDSNSPQAEIIRSILRS